MISTAMMITTATSMTRQNGGHCRLSAATVIPASEFTHKPLKSWNQERSGFSGPARALSLDHRAIDHVAPETSHRVHPAPPCVRICILRPSSPRADRNRVRPASLYSGGLPVSEGRRGTWFSCAGSAPPNTARTSANPRISPPAIEPRTKRSTVFKAPLLVRRMPAGKRRSPVREHRALAPFLSSGRAANRCRSCKPVAGQRLRKRARSRWPRFR